MSRILNCGFSGKGPCGSSVHQIEDGPSSPPLSSRTGSAESVLPRKHGSGGGGIELGLEAIYFAILLGSVTVVFCWKLSVDFSVTAIQSMLVRFPDLI
jgi:hypothetical protein